MKKINLRFLALLLFGLLSKAQALGLSDMNSSAMGGGLGMVSASDGSMVAVATLQPDLKLGDFGFGLNVNVLLDPTKKPNNFEAFSMRWVEYDNGSIGGRYGLLSDITLGYGLLMDSYSTARAGQSVFSAEQAGIRAYTKLFDPLGVYILSTNSKLVALRLTQTLSKDLLLGRPLTLGETYIYDRDGVLTSSGTIGGDQGAGGVDIGMPIMENLWEVFAEYGVLNNYGAGTSLGTKFKFGGELLDLRFAYQMLSGRFVPAYFNKVYEDSPVNPATVPNENKNGWFGTAGIDLLGFGRFESTYQSFTTSSGTQSNTVQAALGVKEFQGISFVANYLQPNFAGIGSLSSNNATILVDFSYPLNPFTKMIGHYTKVYTTSTAYTESYSAELSFQLPISF